MEAKNEYTVKRLLSIERDKWLETLSIDGKDRLLYELEMLMKASERFFNIDNLPVSNREQIISKNFYNELKILADAAKRIISIVRLLLVDKSANAFYFQAYVENRLLADYARDRVIEIYLNQSSPRDSLYLLYITFLNLGSLYEAVARSKKVSYGMYSNLGQLTSREISLNKYFNPLKLEPFLERYDRIHDHHIRTVVGGIDDENLRLKVSIVFLSLFKLLRYLRYVNNESEDIEKLRSSLLIFTLIHAEAKMITKFLDDEFLKQKSNRTYENGIITAMDSLSFQMSIEIRKVFGQILKDAIEIGNLLKLRAAIDSAKGILTNFIQQSIILVVHKFDPYLKGKEIFPDFISRIEQSLRLREDIWLFKSVLEFFEDNTSENGMARNHMPGTLFNMVRDYIYYFQDISFSLVRYSDHEEFEKFFDSISAYRGDDLLNKFKFIELRKSIHNFKIFLETTFGHIANRSELKDMPLDTKHLQTVLAQFLPAR
ncbi:MAG: hypothetical protein M1491_09175 [Deltaproteobacteria bacterium]|nr:hypothetical protein [Deltaproteobacteria bacterium]MCL5276798.1 hypothetical protein [Deltaproteobacteria bacterium]